MQILASSRRISGSSLPGNSVRYAVENDRKHDDLYVGTIEYPLNRRFGSHSNDANGLKHRAES